MFSRENLGILENLCFLTKIRENLGFLRENTGFVRENIGFLWENLGFLGFRTTDS